MNDCKREVAKAFVGALGNGLSAAARQYLAPDFSWWTPLRGQIEDKPDAIDAMLSAHLDGPLLLTVHRVIVEGNYAAVEAESLGRLHNGTIYNNQYHFHLAFEGDKIVSVKEYNNTKHAADTWSFVQSGT